MFANWGRGDKRSVKKNREREKRKKVGSVRAFLRQLLLGYSIFQIDNDKSQNNFFLAVVPCGLLHLHDSALGIAVVLSAQVHARPALGASIAPTEKSLTMPARKRGCSER